MNAEVRHDINVLNELIETTLDSADGYGEAAKDANTPAVKNLFTRWSDDRRQVVAELQQRVRDLGGEPEDDGSMLASAHRVFVNIREALNKSDKGVIDEVERGEDFIKSKYERALEDEDLSLEVRQSVIRAYASVKAGHDQARDLKHNFHS